MAPPFYHLSFYTVLSLEDREAVYQGGKTYTHRYGQGSWGTAKWLTQGHQGRLPQTGMETHQVAYWAAP